jgi:thymidine kinase
MAKLYFRFGSMSSSKSANALMTKFNYEEKGYKVLLLKPQVDKRDGKTIVKSRIGLSAEAEIIKSENEHLCGFENVANKLNHVNL